MKHQHIRRTAAFLAVLLTFGSLLVSCDKKGDNKNDITKDITKEISQGADQSRPQTGAESVPSGADIEPVTGSAEQVVTPDTLPETETVEDPTAGSYEPTDETVITLGADIQVNGIGAVADGKVATITKAGTYLISGSMADGQIMVDTVDESKVVLILNGVSLTCTDGPAIFVKSAPKRVEIYTAQASVNILSDGSGYVIPDDQQTEGGIYPNACIYSCEDLRFEGEGTLYINGNADKGVNTKDDLDIRSGTLIVTSVGVGIRGNDSVTISGGEMTVTSGSDGIKSANIETEGKGQIVIESGTLYITATGDGLSAATDLTVNGGTLVINTKDAGNNSLSASTRNSYDALWGPGGGGGGFPGPGGGGFPGGGGGGGMPGEGNSNKSSISAKGLKAAGTLIVSGGKITIDSADDGIHSDDAVWIKNGSIYISANDDGIHADNTLTVSGGITEVTKSYEGLEAVHITISGGTNRITASDDGTNANGGSSMGMGGGGWWGSSENNNNDSDSGETPLLTVSGGYTVINANGDGIDSNGNIVMTGGVLYVYGPTSSMNGPIDSGDGGYGMTISGGILLAVGSSGMAESAENDGQAVLAASWRSGGLSAGATIGIVDKDGKVLAAFELPKSIQSIVFSCPELVVGESYSIVSGGTTTAEVVDGVIDPETYTGFESMGDIQTS